MIHDFHTLKMLIIFVSLATLPIWEGYVLNWNRILKCVCVKNGQGSLFCLEHSWRVRAWLYASRFPKSLFCKGKSEKVHFTGDLAPANSTEH